MQYQTSKIVFKDLLSILVNWFNKKLTSEQARIIYESLYHINPDSLRCAFENMTKTRKPTPGQFPTVTEIFAELKGVGVKPGIGEPDEYQHCDDCQNKGLLWVYQIQNGLYQEVSYICASCNNWQRHFKSLEHIDGDGKRTILKTASINQLMDRNDVLGPANHDTTQQAARLNSMAQLKERALTGDYGPNRISGAA